MDTNFAMLVAPRGCFTCSNGHISIQRDSQAYHANPRRDDSRAARKNVVREIARSSRLDARVTAVIESYFYRFEKMSNWHILRDDQKTAAVAQFYATTKQAAAGITEVMATSGADSMEAKDA